MGGLLNCLLKPANGYWYDDVTEARVSRKIDVEKEVIERGQRERN